MFRKVQKRKKRRYVSAYVSQEIYRCYLLHNGNITMRELADIFDLTPQTVSTHLDKHLNKMAKDVANISLPAS